MFVDQAVDQRLAAPELNLSDRKEVLSMKIFVLSARSGTAAIRKFMAFCIIRYHEIAIVRITAPRECHGSLTFLFDQLVFLRFRNVFMHQFTASEIDRIALCLYLFPELQKLMFFPAVLLLDMIDRPLYLPDLFIKVNMLKQSDVFIDNHMFPDADAYRPVRLK